MNIHLAVDDQRSPLVAAEQTSRERPADFQVLDVVGVDLSKRAVMVRTVILALHRPIVFALGQRLEFVFRQSRGRGERDAETDA